MKVSKQTYINTFAVSLIILIALIALKDVVITGFTTLDNSIILFTTYDWFIIIFTWLVIVSGFGMFVKGKYDKKK